MKITAIIENRKPSGRHGLKLVLTMVIACIGMQSTSAYSSSDNVKNDEEADILNIENSYVQEFLPKGKIHFFRCYKQLR